MSFLKMVVSGCDVQIGDIYAVTKCGSNMIPYAKDWYEVVETVGDNLCASRKVKLTNGVVSKTRCVHKKHKLYAENTIYRKQTEEIKNERFKRA